MRKLSWIVVMVVCWPALVLAHPGHGYTEPASVRHYLIEPVHAVPITITLAVIAAVVTTGALIVQRWRARRG